MLIIIILEKSVLFLCAKMTNRPEEVQIPEIIYDSATNTSYLRQRFFGKVN